MGTKIVLFAEKRTHCKQKYLYFSQERYFFRTFVVWLVHHQWLKRNQV